MVDVVAGEDEDVVKSPEVVMKSRFCRTASAVPLYQSQSFSPVLGGRILTSGSSREVPGRTVADVVHKRQGLILRQDGNESDNPELANCLR